MNIISGNRWRNFGELVNELGLASELGFGIFELVLGTE